MSYIENALGEMSGSFAEMSGGLGDVCGSLGKMVYCEVYKNLTKAMKTIQ